MVEVIESEDQGTKPSFRWLPFSRKKLSLKLNEPGTYILSCYSGNKRIVKRFKWPGEPGLKLVWSRMARYDDSKGSATPVLASPPKLSSSATTSSSTTPPPPPVNVPTAPPSTGTPRPTSKKSPEHDWAILGEG